MPKLLKTPLGIMLGLLVLIGFIILAGHYAGAFAADLSSVGGACCADLEERIAELEATAAKKGGKKMTLVVYGQISESLVWLDAPGVQTSHLQVQSNSNRDAQSFVGFKGEATVSPSMRVGFVLEVGTGGFGNAVIFTPQNGTDTNQIYIRQELAYIENDGLGKVSIGKQMLATYGVTGTNWSNSAVAHTALSIAPLTGPTLGLDIFDGGITNSLKYVSPHFGASKGPKPQDGIWLEADWANADKTQSVLNPSGPFSTNGNLWDVAIKAMHEFGEFKVAAQAGYKNGIVIDATTLGIPGGLNLQDVKTWSASASVMHAPTGVFANVSYADLSYKDVLNNLGPGGPCNNAVTSCNDLKAWESQVGVEERWTKLGKTTLFANYGQFNMGGTSTFDLIGLGTTNALGAGIVQNLEGAATDLYLSWEDYQLSSQLKTPNTPLTGDVNVIMGGARVKF